jgi:DNA-binding LytR/AlgR family response regulator
VASALSRLGGDAVPTALIADDEPQLARDLAWLTVGLASTIRLVAVSSVLYFQSTDKYTEVVTAHERHLVRTPLKALLAALDSREFVRIHRSTIVNLGAIERIERDVLGRCRVHLKDHADVLTVSRTFLGRFRQM